MVATTEKRKGGRPAKQFSREHLDAALELLGREFLSSRIVGKLQEKFAGLGRAKAYKLLAAARGELRAQLAGEGVPPAALLWAAYQRFIFDESVRPEARISALNGACKLIFGGAIQELGNEDAVVKLLADIADRRAGRTVTPNTNTQEG